MTASAESSAYFNDIVQEIRNNLEAYLVSRGIHIQRNGRFQCPFPENHEHGDRNPSAAVYRNTKGVMKWKCHGVGCSQGGDIFDMANKLEGLPVVREGFVATVLDLANRFGITVDTERLRVDDLLQSLEENALRKDIMQEVEDYIAINGNGLASLTSGRFGRTYTEEEAGKVLDILPMGCVDAAEMTAKLREKYGEALKLLPFYWDKQDYIDPSVFTRNRLIIPIHDDSGQPVAFAGRIATDIEATGMKYKFTNGFGKTEDAPFFMFDRARPNIKALGIAHIVEGQFDTISMHIGGFTTAVGVMGASLNTHHVDMLLQNGVHEVVLCFDYGMPGFLATRKAIDLLKGYNVTISVSVLPEGHDPDSIIRSGDTGIFRAPIDAVEYLLTYDTSFSDPKMPYLNKYRKILEFVTSITSSVVRYRKYAPLISSLVGGQESDIIKDLEQYKKNMEINNPVLVKLWSELKESDHLLPAERLVLVDRIRTDLGNLITHSTRGVLDNTWSLYQRLLRGEEEMPYIFKTGYPILDSMMKIESKTLTFVAASPSHGKSSLMRQLCLSMLREDDDTIVFYISLDDSTVKTLGMFISLLSDIPKDDVDSRIREGTLTDVPQYRARQDEISMMIRNRLHIVGRQDCSNITSIKRELEIFRSNFPNKRLITVIDAMDDLSDLKVEEKRAGIENVLMELADIAVDYDTTMFLVKHLVKKDGRYRPQLVDIKGSSAVEYYAKIILLLHNELKCDQETPLIWSGTASSGPVIEVHLAKDKDRQANVTTFLNFYPQVGNFYEPTLQQIKFYERHRADSMKAGKGGGHGHAVDSIL